MFQKFSGGFDLFVLIHKLLFKRPVLFIPVLGCWLVYAATILYLKFNFDWSGYSFEQSLAIFFLIILFFSFIISITNFILLELLEQFESGKPTSIVKAVSDAIKKNLPKALPIIFVWALLWFVVVVIEAMTKNKDNDDSSENDNKFNAENAARELANIQEFSWGSLMFDSVKKGFRMIAFMTFPAIAWENTSTSIAFKRGVRVAKTHWVEMGTGFLLTSLCNQFVFFPVSVIFAIASVRPKYFPEEIWPFVLLYIALAWSYVVYLEVLFTAELYLWDLNWRKAVTQAEAKGMKVPEFYDVKRPSFNDDIPDFKRIFVKDWDAKKKEITPKIQSDVVVKRSIEPDIKHNFEIEPDLKQWIFFSVGSLALGYFLANKVCRLADHMTSYLISFPVAIILYILFVNYFPLNKTAKPNDSKNIFIKFSSFFIVYYLGRGLFHFIYFLLLTKDSTDYSHKVDSFSKSVSTYRSDGREKKAVFYSMSIPSKDIELTLDIDFMEYQKLNNGYNHVTYTKKTGKYLPFGCYCNLKFHKSAD
jgi:hypothetical protein